MKITTKNLLITAEIFLTILIAEILFKSFTLGFSTDKYTVAETLIVMLVTAATAGLLTLVKTLLPGKSGDIAFSVIVGIGTLFFAAQTVYYAIFETFFTFYSMANGAQVFEFQEVILSTVWKEIIPIIVFVALAALLIYLSVFRIKRIHMSEWTTEWSNRKDFRNSIIISALIMALTFSGGYAIGSIKSDDPASPYQYLYGVNEIRGTVKSFGLLSAMCIDVSRLIFGFEPKIESAPVEQPEPEPDDNVIESLDFAALAEAETDGTIKTMHEHFGNIDPTKQNDKTGIFKGKNLIFITAESFTDFAVNAEYTPTLYKLQTEGYTFSNFYNPVWGVSTLDGEYVNLQSLVPKPGVWSMKESKDNALPFTFGNQFLKLGYSSKAYHDHSIYYYDRQLSHPNLGYDFKGQDGGYHFERTWPESDIEMIDKTTYDFLTPDESGNINPFNIYYLTVSGHLNYNFYGNVMAYKNQSLVENMQMSEPCRAYMACNIEFDRAMKLLLERLEEAGQLENTVIAIAGDHYPYGLKEDAISEFKGHPVDTTYEMYESTFLLWTPGMKPEQVDKVCCNMDILPTLSNMFGLKYDSRLLMGTDIFSGSEGLVMFKDKNWITAKGTREALIGVDDEYVAETDRKVADKFNYSTLILDKNYYKYLNLN